METTLDRLERIKICPVCSAAYSRDAWPKSACGKGLCPALSVTPPDFTEQAMLDWLQDKAEEGHVSMCFEVDGGVHITIEPLGGERRAVRNADTIRDAIIRLMKEDFS